MRARDRVDYRQTKGAVCMVPTALPTSLRIKELPQIGYALMYQPIKPAHFLPIMYQCQDCEETFAAGDGASRCPYCLCKDRTNLIILHMEEDEDRALYLELIDFTAGD
jgi:hypothetical protein